MVRQFFSSFSSVVVDLALVHSPSFLSRGASHSLNRCEPTALPPEPPPPPEIDTLDARFTLLFLYH